MLSLGDLTRRSRSRGAHADPPKAAGAKHRSAGRWAAWRGRGASVRGAAEMWGSDRRAAHLRHLPEGLARLCISFFCFVLFLEASLLRVRGRMGSDSWGAQRSLSSDTSPPPHARKAPQPGCSAGGEEEDAGNKLRDLLARGNGCFTTRLLYPGHSHR